MNVHAAEPRRRGRVVLQATAAAEVKRHLM